MSKYKYSGVVPNLKNNSAWSEIVSVGENKYTCIAHSFIPEVAISKIIYANPATIVLWDDGTKTVSKCAEGDTYSKETGLSICILKKIIGATNVHNIFADWIPENSNTIRVADVRKKHKEDDIQ